MAAAIKMDELLVSWLGSDNVYENVLKIVEAHRTSNATGAGGSGEENKSTSLSRPSDGTPPPSPTRSSKKKQASTGGAGDDGAGGGTAVAANDKADDATRTGIIPPFYRPAGVSTATATAGGGGDGVVVTPPPSPPARRKRSSFGEDQSWDGDGGGGPSAAKADGEMGGDDTGGRGDASSSAAADPEESPSSSSVPSIRERVRAIFDELGTDPPLVSPSSAVSGGSEGGGGAGAEDEGGSSYDRRYLASDQFVRITKDVCGFPTFFNGPLYRRILRLWNDDRRRRRGSGDDGDSTGGDGGDMDVVTHGMIRWYWKREMEPHDAPERFYRLLKQPDKEYVGRDDFLPYIKELLNDHPGLEFLSNHAEFQEKYAVTVITRIFYSVNRCHSGRITSRQIRRSDLLAAFQQVDEEEDINKVTRYFSYEHFYVLYCRFWELDHDRDYRITREDLLKYGDHSLSHMIVDRIFDAAPRPFEGGNNAEAAGADGAAGCGGVNRDYLSYEDFIFFMLSEEDKANEISVRYWFSCIDVDGDGKLNNMEMRSFYAVQLHRMQCMGHEIVPFEDMLCQMMDMIKPTNPDYLVVEDFLQPECSQVSGALFDALFNLNKYLQFEQRDPFMERQKREDEFETDWDRFACIDYNRLAMEEEAREEEAMEIDWVTVDDEDDDGDDFNSLGLGGASEAPF